MAPEESVTKKFESKMGPGPMATSKQTGSVGKDPSQGRKEPTPPKFRSFHDFYLTQGKQHNRDFLTVRPGYRASWQGQIRHTPNHLLQPKADDGSAKVPETYKRYDEKELSTVLKGHVKRLCEYFQNAVPNKNYTDTIKAMVAKTKPRRMVDSSRSDSSCSTTNSVKPQAELDFVERVNRVQAPAVGIIELAQHLASKRTNCKWPTTNHEALEFLEHEGIAYNNALMVMESARQGGAIKQVFNWKTAMKAMCTGGDMPDTPSSSLLERADLIRVDLPLPLDTEMRDFLRKRGFVIGENGMPIVDADEATEYDGVRFFVLPHCDSAREMSKRRTSNATDQGEVWADVKTGPVIPDISHDPDTLKIYDLQVNKVATEPDLVANFDEDEYDPATSLVNRKGFFDQRECSLDDFTNHIFGYADPQNLNKVIADIRRIMPEECDGKETNDDELLTDRREQNAEGFEWFLNPGEPVKNDISKVARNILEEPATDIDEDVIEQFSWMKTS
ncbi:diguanylate cyclase, putative [Babesia ovis]|uniref:Diguanylate cyclase, putative n=1 Tax=Babesia ovis TaxID=5869 RepID=A0A9W5WTX9_BABOV|nr:diguanylate cyclase, putative [Babesia ovis]